MFSCSRCSPHSRINPAVILLEQKAQMAENHVRKRRDKMSVDLCRRAVHVTFAVTAMIGFLFVSHATAQTLVENSSEARFQLDVHVPDAVLVTFLPKGWSPNIATQGAAKDCNLRVVFIDRVTINGPDGKPVGKGSNRLVYLVAPVKDPSGANVQLVIGGLTEDPADAPGPFGNYLLATTHNMQRTTSSAANGVADSQDWLFMANTGERLELHIKYERGV